MTEVSAEVVGRPGEVLEPTRALAQTVLGMGLDEKEEQAKLVERARVEGSAVVSARVVCELSTPEAARRYLEQVVGLRVRDQVMRSGLQQIGEIEVLRIGAPAYREEFADAAIEAVRQWRYKPARRAGKPVPVYFTIFVEYKLH